MGFSRETLATKYGAMAAALQQDPPLLRRALAFLRVTGEVLFYDQVPALADTVFIRPQWLVDVLKELVRHDLPQLVAQLADPADASAMRTPTDLTDPVDEGAPTAAEDALAAERALSLIHI